jgi:hypothetical protein
VTPYGIIGAAAAAGLSYVVALTTSVVFAWNLIRVSPRDLFVLRVSDLTTALAVLRHTFLPAFSVRSDKVT